MYNSIADLWRHSRYTGLYHNVNKVMQLMEAEMQVEEVIQRLMVDLNAFIKNASVSW
ncbi:hypothetical protein DPMN_062837 [Dreissena polymorpha]|uniref:Uncharacterized protein n=1 Tax=Dreissena polymorpha TaxID=45954 RepID=A0A9D4C9E6_DREPO|nr:hypothetical protein DPMN_062837 [Dreissena polymorpha]